MKALILGLIMSYGINDNESKVADYSWVLDEMNAKIEIASDLGLAESKIKIFDLDGNMTAQYSQEQFIKNELPLSELKEIMESEFLFDYQGDSYYLKPSNN